MNHISELLTFRENALKAMVEAKQQLGEDLANSIINEGHRFPYWDIQSEYRYKENRAKCALLYINILLYKELEDEILKSKDHYTVNDLHSIDETKRKEIQNELRKL